MAENSEIEWTDHTFNPWIGCAKVSPGCANCYAEDLMSRRYGRVRWGKGQPRRRTALSTWAMPLRWNKRLDGTGRRERVFCASLADWLDEEVPIEWFSDLLRLIVTTPHLDWLLLTKRPENAQPRLLAAAHLFPTFSEALVAWSAGHPPPNVWVGASIENQEWTDARIPALLTIPAKVHFLSCEPLLGPIVLPEAYLQKGKAAWVIVGGESGERARAMHPDWACDVAKQCQRAEVPFFFKQWGMWRDGVRMGKSAAGRLLGGVEWNEVPL